MRALRGGLALAYPALVFFGLQRFSARQVALAALLVVLIRPPTMLGTLLTGRRERWALAAMAGLMLAASLGDSETLLRLYPVLVNAVLLALFAHSLRYPPSMIERIARLTEPDLPPSGVRYTRRVTAVWCGFFLGNGAVAAWTALAASREVWVLYNGLLAYILMGLLFAGEWLLRSRLRTESSP